MSNASSDIKAHGELAPVTWGAGSAVLVAVGGYVFSTVMAGILLSIIPMFLGHTGDQLGIWLEESFLAQFVYILLVEIMTMAILFWYVRRKHGKPAALGLRKPKPKDAVWMVLGVFAYFLPFLVVSAVLSGLGLIDTEQQQELIFNTETIAGLWPLTAVFFCLVLLPPLVEETLFRGFLFSGLRRRFTIVVAALLTSVLFALPHMMQSHEGILWIAGLDTFILSLVLCWLRVKTGNLWAGIGVHALKNGIAFVSLFILHLK